MLPNAVGAAIGAFGTYAHTMYSSTVPWQIFGGSLFVLLITFHFWVQGQDYAVGLIGCVLSVAVTGAPLAVIKNVIDERSTASMPFLSSLAVFLCAVSWMTYGLVIANDPIIYAPNILGSLLGASQMVLFAVFGIDRRDPAYPYVAAVTNPSSSLQ